MTLLIASLVCVLLAILCVLCLFPLPYESNLAVLLLMLSPTFMLLALFLFVSYAVRLVITGQ